MNRPGRLAAWWLLASPAFATAAVLILRLPGGGVAAGLLLAAAWVWAVSRIRALQADRALLNESIAQLQETVDRWAAGDLDARVYLDQEDPLDPIAHGMNRVAEVLRERTRDLNEDKDRLDAILSSMANGIIIFTHGLTVSLINDAAVRLFGIKEAQPQGRHVLEVLRDVALTDALDEVTREGRTVTADWSPSDDESRVVECTIAPFRQPVGGLGAVLVARDVSSQRQVNRLRQDFVANVSHELQTPLTVIQGFTETLMNEPDPVRAPRFLSLIYEETNRMSRLVDDLLALSRLEHHSLPVTWQAVDLTDLAEGTLARLDERARAAGLELENALPDRIAAVAGDPDLLSEVLLNLVSNAIQYTPEGGHIRLDAAVDAEHGEVGLRVKDTGIGIPATDLGRIFERFYRVDRARSRASGGTGLGLAIVKHIIEVHRGRIEVKSAVGQGSEFTVWLRHWQGGER